MRALATTPRLWHARITSLSQIANRTIDIGVKFVSVPMAIAIVGNEVFGVWLTLLSIIAWFTISDIGIPSAIVNPMSEAIGVEDNQRVNSLISSSFIFLSAIGTGIFVIGAVLICILPIEAILGMQHAAVDVYVRMAAVIVLCSSVGLMNVRLLDTILLAMQKGYWTSIQNVVASFLTLAGLVALKITGGNIASLAFVMVAPSLFVRIISWGILATKHRSPCLPNFKTLSLTKSLYFGTVGSLFLIGSIGELLLLQTPYFIIARTLGASSVPQFAIPYQVFYAAYLLLCTMSAPLWPAYAEAKAVGDYAWIKRTHWRIFRETFFLAVVGYTVLGVLMPWLLAQWLGPAYIPSREFLLVLIAQFVQWSLNFSWSVLLTGLGHIKERTYIVVAMGIVAVPLISWFTHRFGIAGVALGLFVAMLTTQTWLLPATLIRKEKWVFLPLENKPCPSSPRY